MGTHVNIRFHFTRSDGVAETKTMWTLKQADGYKIDNIPFYAAEPN